jgi:hypothetical protein
MRYLLSLLLLSVVMADVHAEGGCPAGMYPIGGGSGGWSGCAPIPNNGGQPAADAGPQWSSRWGAIAADSGTASVASVGGLSSKRKAEKEAVARCRASGGSKACKIWLTFENQCGVFVVGNGLASAHSASDIEVAKRNGLTQCRAGGNGECTVISSQCSYAERIR